MACLLLCVTVLTVVEILLAEISEDTGNKNNSGTESWKVTLSSVWYLHSSWGRDSAVLIYLECVNKLLPKLWHVHFVTCFLYCLLLSQCSDKLCNNPYPPLSKEKNTELRGSREIQTKDEAVMDQGSKSSCIIPLLVLHWGKFAWKWWRTFTEPLDQSCRPLLQEERWDVPALPCLLSWRCSCSHMKVPFKNWSL